MGNVIVFGSLNMDLSIACDRMPRAGETIAGRDLLVNPGGKGANQAVASARMGARTLMIGAVGADAFGEQLVQTLQQAGVDTRRVERAVDAATGTAIILRTGGDNRIVLDAGANRLPTADAVAAALDEFSEPHDIVVAQLECDASSTFDALARAHDAGLYTIFNPAPAREIPRGLWSAVDLVCLNETECGIVCGVEPRDERDVPRAARALRELGARCAIITLGAGGSAVCADGAVERIAPVPVDAVDSTAAGDTYIGALAAELAHGTPVVAAARFASRAAALTVTRKGAQQSIPTRDEVDAFTGPDA